ncbi:MAG: hypothetical protein H5T59_12295, partial [Anaerolineae bacterium]|nr:hypothetical protein [Anaerolineae bacterium]
MESVQEWFRRRGDLVAVALMACLALAASALAFQTSPLWALAGLAGVLALCAVWWGWPRSGLLALF